MTLAELATFVCNELGLFDDFSVQLAKSFLDKEYKMLWDRYPWTDTQTTATVSISQGTRSVPYPDGINRIITVSAETDAARVDVPDALNHVSDARFLDPVNATFLIETDPTILERGGYPLYYEENTNTTTGVKNIRIYPTPTADTTLFLIAKATCNGLTQDSDSPIIRNIDNVLIAYALFDMLQRQRQYGKAKEKREQAKELEAAAWDLEQRQANQPRKNKTLTVAGNTLSEMTDAVCDICGQFGLDYRLVIREFLRRNYQALYDVFLWPESVLAVKVPYTTEQVVMPNYIDKVLGIRGFSNMRLFPADQVLFLDITPTIFEETGDPIGYSILTPVGVAVLPAVATQLTIASTSDADVSKVFIRGELVAQGAEVTEEITLRGVTPVTTANEYEIPITIAKDITFGSVTVNQIIGSHDLLQEIPANMRELKHQRIWLHPVPNSSTMPVGGWTCLVLAKRAIVPLRTDQDSPIITGAQQVLIAAAAADVFTKLGQMDQAGALKAKAEASTQVLINKNNDQQAREPRFVPQIEPSGYCPDGDYVWSK